jgi:sulfur carrier protein
MQILIPGVARQFPAPLPVAALLLASGFGERRVAVEVNREIVPRSRHAAHTLSEGDQVEIIQAIGGG